MIIIKSGVKNSKLTPQMARAEQIVNACYQNFGTKECVVTSGEDGKHGEPGKPSKHYDGNAEDFRTFNVQPDKIVPLVTMVSVALGDEYDVVYEAPERPPGLPDAQFRKSSKPHLHVEYDPQ